MIILNKVSKSVSTTVALCTSALLVSVAVATSAATAATLTYDVTAIQYGSLTDGADSTVNGVTYLNQSLPVTGVVANSTEWEIGGYPQPVVTLRRGGYAPTDNFGNYNNRAVPSSERVVGDPETTVRAPQPTKAEAILNQNNVFAALDNVFVNAGYIHGIQTDIERADFIFKDGLKISPSLAIALFDRGPATAHDAFKVAPVLSIDQAGNPTSYGSLLSIEAGWGQPNLRPGGSAADNLPYTILTNSGGAFGNVLSVNQQIGGLLIPLTELSTASTIYGYSLFSPDVKDGGNSANLLDWKNSAFFPQDTSNAIGGFDLVAGSGQVAAVPEPTTVLGSLAVGGMLAVLRRQQKSRQIK